jgi:hypothetical protein
MKCNEGGRYKGSYTYVLIYAIKLKQASALQKLITYITPDTLELIRPYFIKYYLSAISGKRNEPERKVTAYMMKNKRFIQQSF